MNGVVALEVASPPGSRRFRLVGELSEPRVEPLAAALRLTQLPGDVLLDLRELTDADGSTVTLLSRVAGRLVSRGRLYVLFPLPPSSGSSTSRASSSTCPT